MRRRRYEDAPEYPGAVRVAGWGAGIAFRVAGWETEADDDSEWSGYYPRTGALVVVMVGDDARHVVEPGDVSPLAESEYCADCGQIGCGWHVVTD